MKKLFLLDGMALVYRAHFALAARPIFTSKGVNTSALFGFAQTLLDIIKNQQPTHIAIAFDTAAPTQRHRDFPDYKIQREAMPEDISFALPHVRRLAEALRVPVLSRDGYEADDLIGTLAKQAEEQGFETFMVSPDKDFAQLVTARTLIYKPSRMGDGVEILGVPEILKKWGIQQPEQVIDILGLWGDASDNIPGVPGIGEKTASKLITQYGSIENLLAHTHELKGKVKEALETHREQALLSKRLAAICREAPCAFHPEELLLRPPNEEQLKALLIEFEFNSIGRRLFGDAFKSGRGFEPAANQSPAPEQPAPALPDTLALPLETPEPPPPASPRLKTIRDVPNRYHAISTPGDRARLIQNLAGQTAFSLATERLGADPKSARLLGLAFAFQPGESFFVPLPASPPETAAILEEFRPLLQNPAITLVGHDLKADLSVLRWNGLSVLGRLFDAMLAHSLVEPSLRHGLEYLAEAYLGYTPIPLNRPPENSVPGQIDLDGLNPNRLSEQACERADLAWQLQQPLKTLLRDKSQGKVFHEIESPLIPALVDMEFEGIRVNAAALADFGQQLQKEMREHETRIRELAGTDFNVNSPRQLGEVLFDRLRLAPNAKKTRTGQYATDEQTLLSLASDHEIVQRLLDYRACSKLKSTYADALPAAIFPQTQRVHTTYNQAVTATGRLQSENPNLQNIPIRTERGKEIRKAFIPRNEEFLLLSADYSQIELRIIASLSREQTMIEAFRKNLDIHAATAARVYGVFLETVTEDMRRKAKMVNYGIAYGISAFGLAQRLRIPRKEAAAIIDQYFAQFPGIQDFMTRTIETCRKQGYVETITGRRRYLRDISSSNAAVRGAAERNAINAPIQGAAADMIKIAMAQIHRELVHRRLKTRLLLQVHDELVFDLHRSEEAEVRDLAQDKMKNALPLEVPIIVEIGTGQTWLEAH